MTSHCHPQLPVCSSLHLHLLGDDRDWARAPMENTVDSKGKREALLHMEYVWV